MRALFFFFKLAPESMSLHTMLYFNLFDTTTQDTWILMQLSTFHEELHMETSTQATSPVLSILRILLQVLQHLFSYNLSS